MGVDDTLRTLLHDRERELVGVLRAAYETGYREGLASQVAVSAEATAAAERADALPPSLAPESAPTHKPMVALTPAGGLFPDSGSAEQDDDDDDEGDDDDREVVPVAAVRSSISVGGLLRRIEKVFALDRFDILVRIEDPRTHRHLKRGVRLSRYVREGA